MARRTRQRARRRGCRAPPPSAPRWAPTARQAAGRCAAGGPRDLVEPEVSISELVIGEAGRRLLWRGACSHQGRQGLALKRVSPQVAALCRARGGAAQRAPRGARPAWAEHGNMVRLLRSATSPSRSGSWWSSQRAAACATCSTTRLPRWWGARRCRWSWRRAWRPPWPSCMASRRRCCTRPRAATCSSPVATPAGGTRLQAKLTDFGLSLTASGSTLASTMCERRHRGQAPEQFDDSFSAASRSTPSRSSSGSCCTAAGPGKASRWPPRGAPWIAVSGQR